MLDAILSQFGFLFSESQLKQVTEHRGFSGAIVYRVDTENGVLAVRRWPEQTLPEDRIRGLHRFLEQLANTGLTTIAVPYKLPVGGTILKQAKTWWHCEPWMPGTAELHLNFTVERLRSAMQSLAVFHLVARQYSPTQTEQEWFYQQTAGPVPAVSERAELLQAWQVRKQQEVVHLLKKQNVTEAEWISAYLDLFTQLAPAIAHRLNFAAEFKVPISPCLRDVWHDHVLFENDNVTGIIDVTATRSENVAIDLARLLGSFLEPEDAGWTQAIDFYQVHNPLTEQELILVEILDQSSVLLSGLSWIERLVGMNGRLVQNQFIITRLQRLLERLQKLHNTLS